MHSHERLKVYHGAGNRRHSDTDTMVQQHAHQSERAESPQETFHSAEDDIPQLFCQLDVLRRSEELEYTYWKEKARWIRFEEIAETVPGRWSKPHVSTLVQPALLESKRLLSQGVILLDLPLSEFSTISQTIVQSLIDSGHLRDASDGQKLLQILALPHFHHYEKQSVTKMAGSVDATGFDLQQNPIIVINDDPQQTDDFTGSGLLNKSRKSSAEQEETSSISPSVTKSLSKFNNNLLKSLTRVLPDRTNTDYNVKLQRKINDKSEGASVLICPIDFIDEQTMVFVRLQKPVELPGLLEIKLPSRFLVLIIGSEASEKHLLQIGRTFATILADDICREHAYLAQNADDIQSMFERFMQDTYVIPPSEWDPSIRIDPPQKYLSKEERKAQAPEETNGKVDEIHIEEHTDSNLKASKRPFHGLWVDIHNKIPYYLSDFTDCASLQCLAATLYLYLVCLCSVVAFGGMLGTATENYMATMECILAASISGILFALFAGQPLNILSATGPMLILERIIEHMCKDYRVNFLEFRLWIGVWVCLLLVICVAFNLSFLVKYITRFTEDCFASLVAFIFIYDAIREILKIRKLYPVNYRPHVLLDYSCSCLFTDIGENETSLNDTTMVDYLFHGFNLNKTSQLACIEAGGFVTGSGCYTPVYHADIFFFSVLLFVFTFLICMILKEFRHSLFFSSKIRIILSDFAVLIAIILMSTWDAYLRLNTPKLHVPTNFIPTRPHDRGWLIPFFGRNSLWTIPLAIIPALIATILIFMDQQITAVIINRKEFQLKKNLGYHLDLLVLSVCIILQSILGLPWFVAATVLALTHVNALKIMSENTAPGEKPKFKGILEQRVSALLTAILTGLSVFFTQILGHIPMPVLYGVFMFMGVSALRNMQIFDRILLFFMPQKHQPDYPYLRHVPILRVHLFTIIQILALVGMFAIKNFKSIAIAFPLLVLATCFVRKLMEFIFSQEELYWLDDILPGAKLTRIRNPSVTRQVRKAKQSNKEKRTLNSPYKSSGNEDIELPESNLPNIAEEEAEHLMAREIRDGKDKKVDQINV